MNSQIWRDLLLLDSSDSYAHLLHMSQWRGHFSKQGASSFRHLLEFSTRTVRSQHLLSIYHAKKAPRQSFQNHLSLTVTQIKAKEIPKQRHIFTTGDGCQPLKSRSLFNTHLTRNGISWQRHRKAGWRGPREVSSPAPYWEWDHAQYWIRSGALLQGSSRLFCIQ